MSSHTNEQRLQIIEFYYQNACSVKKVHRSLLPFYGQLNRPTEAAIRAIVTKISQLYRPVDQPLLSVSGDLPSSDEEQMDRWTEHFPTVLNHVVDDNGLPLGSSLPQLNSCMYVNANAPSYEEITSTIRSLPGNKAAGIDGIPSEFYKVNPMLSANLLHPIS